MSTEQRNSQQLRAARPPHQNIKSVAGVPVRVASPGWFPKPKGLKKHQHFPCLNGKPSNAQLLYLPGDSGEPSRASGQPVDASSGIRLPKVSRSEAMAKTPARPLPVYIGYLTLWPQPQPWLLHLAHCSPHLCQLPGSPSPRPGDLERESPPAGPKALPS